jgi:broad specificity phosphatase PhoE
VDRQESEAVDVEKLEAEDGLRAAGSAEDDRPKTLAHMHTVGMTEFDKMASKTRTSVTQESMPRRRCCGLLPPKVAVFEPTIVVLRHSERKDYVDKTYKTSPEGQAWPVDAPLTERGIELAAEVAQELAVLHETACFAAIATSPYRRCMETAAQVAKALKLPVTIDQELGEVRDREMPKDHPAHRSPKQLVEMAEQLELDVLNPFLEDEGEGFGEGYKVFGKEPDWPETLDGAKLRYNVRIENYIEQSQKHQRNFILVTHADAVAAVLGVFQRGCADVQSMDFCARVVAVKNKKQGKKCQGARARSLQPEVDRDAQGDRCRSIF